MQDADQRPSDLVRADITPLDVSRNGCLSSEELGLSQQDVSLLESYVEQLADKMPAEFGIQIFKARAPELARDIRQQVPAHSENGSVPLANANDSTILSALEVLARQKAQIGFRSLAETLANGGRAYPSDCESLERIAMVHGLLAAYIEGQNPGPEAPGASVS